MIYNEEAYYTGYARNVRTFGGGSKGAYTALVFDTIAGLIRDKGIGEVANKTLLDMLGGTKPTLLAAIELIISTGYLERNTSCGRGNKCIYYITEKGKENCPFMTDKRSKNFTEKVKNFNEKGKEILPINKELNKELKEKEETPTPNFETMEDFNPFWSLYPGDPDWTHEKESCERVWHTMPQNWRDNIVQQLQSGLRWRTKKDDNPYWYLRDYAGQTVRGELPYWRQGTAEHTKRLNEADKNGEAVIIMRFEGHLAFCLERDRDTMESAGAEFLSVRQANKSE